MKEKKNHVQKSDVTKFIDEVANNGKSSIKLYSAKTLKEEKEKRGYQKNLEDFIKDHPEIFKGKNS